MACSWQDIRALAFGLKRSASGDQFIEALARNALSRYYYSLFHRARNWAYINKYSGPPRDGSRGGGTHEHLWRSLADKTRTPEFQDKGQSTCHEDRNLADYDIDERKTVFDQETFEDSWSEMSNLHLLLDELPREWEHYDEAVMRQRVTHLRASSRRIWD